MKSPKTERNAINDQRAVEHFSENLLYGFFKSQLLKSKDFCSKSGIVYSFVFSPKNALALYVFRILSHHY